MEILGLIAVTAIVSYCGYATWSDFKPLYISCARFVSKELRFKWLAVKAVAHDIAKEIHHPCFKVSLAHHRHNSSYYSGGHRYRI